MDGVADLDTAVLEPPQCIGVGDGGNGLCDGMIDGLQGAGFEPLDGVLELRPGGLDGVEVGMVGRQEHHPSALRLDQGAGLEVLVGDEVVENDDMTFAKMRTKKMLNERPKHCDGCAPFHGHRRQQTPQAQCTDDRVQPSPLDRLGFVQTLPTRRLAMAGRHRGVGAGLIDEDEVFRIDLLNGLEVRFSQGFDAVGVSFSGYKRLFLRVYPHRCQ